MHEASSIITINSKGIILSVDKNCCILFGYNLEELVGYNVNKIIPAPYKEQHDTYLQNYLTTNRTVEGHAKDQSVSSRIAVFTFSRYFKYVFLSLKLEKVRMLYLLA